MIFSNTKRLSNIRPTGIKIADFKNRKSKFFNEDLSGTPSVTTPGLNSPDLFKLTKTNQDLKNELSSFGSLTSDRPQSLLQLHKIQNQKSRYVWLVSYK